MRHMKRCIAIVLVAAMLTMGSDPDIGQKVSSPATIGDPENHSVVRCPCTTTCSGLPSCLSPAVVHSHLGDQLGGCAEVFGELLRSHAGVVLPDNITLAEALRICQQFSPEAVAAVLWMVKKGKFDWLHIVEEHPQTAPGVRAHIRDIVVPRVTRYSAGEVRHVGIRDVFSYLGSCLVRALRFLRDRLRSLSFDASLQEQAPPDTAVVAIRAGVEKDKPLPLYVPPSSVDRMREWAEEHFRKNKPKACLAQQLDKLRALVARELKCSDDFVALPEVVAEVEALDYSVVNSLEGMELLLDLAWNSSSWVNSRVCFRLKVFGRRILPALIHVLTHEKVEMLAPIALLFLKESPSLVANNEGVVDVLIETVRREFSKDCLGIRGRAAMALKNVWSSPLLVDKAKNCLIDTLQRDPDSWVRNKAAESLGCLGHCVGEEQVVIDMLVDRLVNDPDFESMCTVAEALRCFGDTARGKLRSLLQASSLTKEVRVCILWVLYSSHGDRFSLINLRMSGLLGDKDTLADRAPRIFRAADEWMKKDSAINVLLDSAKWLGASCGLEFIEEILFAKAIEIMPILNRLEFKKDIFASSYYESFHKMMKDQSLSLSKRIKLLEGICVAVDIHHYAQQSQARGLGSLIQEQVGDLVTDIHNVQDVTIDNIKKRMGKLKHKLTMACIKQIVYGDCYSTRKVPLILVEDERILAMTLIMVSIYSRISYESDRDFKKLAGMIKWMFKQMVAEEWQDAQACMSAVNNMIIWGKAGCDQDTVAEALQKANSALFGKLTGPEGQYGGQLWDRKQVLRGKAVSRTRSKEEILLYKRQVYEEMFDLLETQGIELTSVAIDGFQYACEREKLQALPDNEHFDAYMDGIRKQLMEAGLYEGEIASQWPEIEKNIKRFSRKGSGALQWCRVCIGGPCKVFDDLSAVELAAGCYALGGGSDHMPLLHGLEANAFFIRVYDKNNKQISNAVVVLTDRGMLVYGNYQQGNLDLDPLYAGIIAELVWKGYVPGAILSSSSAGYWSMRKAGYGERPRFTQTTKESVGWKKPSYDSLQGITHQIDQDGNITYTLDQDKVLYVTRESLEKAGYGARRGEWLLPEEDIRQKPAMAMAGLVLSDVLMNKQASEDTRTNLLKVQQAMKKVIRQGGMLDVAAVKEAVDYKRYFGKKTSQVTDAEEMILTGLIKEVLSLFKQCYVNTLALRMRKAIDHDLWKDPLSVLGWADEEMQLKAWGQTGGTGVPVPYNNRVGNGLALSEVEGHARSATKKDTCPRFQQLMKRLGITQVNSGGSRAVWVAVAGKLVVQEQVFKLWKRLENKPNARKAIEIYLEIGVRIAASKNPIAASPEMVIYHLLDEHCQDMYPEEVLSYWYQYGLAQRRFVEEYLGEAYKNHPVVLPAKLKPQVSVKALRTLLNALKKLEVRKRPESCSSLGDLLYSECKMVRAA